MHAMTSCVANPVIECLNTDDGTRVSYDKSGSGPALVLVHGSFNGQKTNWECVLPAFRKRFTVYAVDWLKRSGIDDSERQTAEDEGRTVAAVIREIDEPVFLVGHSYGAQSAVGAALEVPDRVRKLVLYEPPKPFDTSRCRQLGMPVLLQIGSESRRQLYVTDALAAVLPDGRIGLLPGQAHESMTTAPRMYADAVANFLLR